MSAGLEVPKRIFSHGFLFNRGEKMSKSVGNVIDPFALADAYGVDQLRYFFLGEVPFGQDGNYSHEAIVNRINADLANDLGNLAQRSLSMIAKQLGGILPAPGELSANDKTILAAADGMIAGAREAMKTQQIHQMLNVVWSVVADANRYFGRSTVGAGQDRSKRQGTVLYVTAEIIRQVAILAQPVVPEAAGSFSISWPCRKTSAISRCWAGRSVSSQVLRCRLPAAFSRAMSSRTQPRPCENHAGRQPLPSRFSRLRR